MVQPLLHSLFLFPGPLAAGDGAFLAGVREGSRPSRRNRRLSRCEYPFLLRSNANEPPERDENGRPHRKEGFESNA
jgi:hypothetical protein